MRKEARYQRYIREFHAAGAKWQVMQEAWRQLKPHLKELCEIQQEYSWQKANAPGAGYSHGLTKENEKAFQSIEELGIDAMIESTDETIEELNHFINEELDTLLPLNPREALVRPSSVVDPI